MEGSPVWLPLLPPQPGLSQLPLHLLLPRPFSQPPSQEPLPQQEPLPHPTFPAQRGRSDWSGGDGCGHRGQSKSRQQCGPLSGVCVHQIQPATDLSAVICTTGGHLALVLSQHFRERLQGSHAGSDSKQPEHQHSLYPAGFKFPKLQCKCEWCSVPERRFREPVRQLQRHKCTG